MRLPIKARRLLNDVLPRVLVDATSLCAALFCAFSVDFIVHALYTGRHTDFDQFEAAFKLLYVENVFILVPLGILVLALFGCYTHTRTYQGRYKILVVVNAVSLTYLIEVLLYSYVLTLGSVSRGAMLLAWLFSLLLIAGSRILKNRVTESYSIVRKPTDGNRNVTSVLVIGGAGYIGAVLIRQLLEEGYRVRVLDSLLFGDSSISELLNKSNFELLKADFRRVDTLVKAVQGIDAVIHLAAIVGDPACTINTELTTEINYAATRMLTEVCRGAGVNRLLFASTCSVYGASDFLMDERSVPNPVSLYAQSKLESERVILECRNSTFSPTILRLATVFGLSPRPRFDLVVNLLTARAVQEGKIIIFNHDQWRPFIHVEDVARAFVCVLRAPVGVAAGEIFNVGSYKLNFTLGQVAEKIREQLPALEIDNEENLDKRNYRVSFEKIHSDLGFTSKIGLEVGISEIRRTLENGVIKDYRSRVFSNYDFLMDAKDELLRSEPIVQIFSVLEPADVYRIDDQVKGIAPRKATSGFAASPALKKVAIVG